MATTRYSDLSCHVEPNGVTKFSETHVTDEHTITASAETDNHGNIKKGEWTQTDDKGTVLSVTYPDGKMTGRDVPKDPDFQEGLRTDRGDLLERKAKACKTASSMSLF